MVYKENRYDLIFSLFPVQKGNRRALKKEDKEGSAGSRAEASPAKVRESSGASVMVSVPLYADNVMVSVPVSATMPQPVSATVPVNVSATVPASASATETRPVSVPVPNGVPSLCPISDSCVTNKIERPASHGLLGHPLLSEAGGGGGQEPWQLPGRAGQGQGGGRGAVEQTGIGAVAETGRGAVGETGRGAEAETGRGAVEETGRGAVTETGRGTVAETGKGAVSGPNRNGVLNTREAVDSNSEVLIRFRGRRCQDTSMGQAAHTGVRKNRVSLTH